MVVAIKTVGKFCVGNVMSMKSINGKYMNGDNFEVYLAYEDYDGNICEESVSVIKEGENYRLDGIPIFASNLAAGDMINVEHDEGKLYFHDLIKKSGNSTVQIVIFDQDQHSSIVESLDKFGCTYARIEIPNYISANIPAYVDYKEIRLILDSYASKGALDFKEACLGAR